MSGGGDAGQTDELAAAAHRLAVLADRIRDLRNRLAGVPGTAAPSGERGASAETAQGPKGDAR